MGNTPVVGEPTISDSIKTLTHQELLDSLSITPDPELVERFKTNTDRKRILILSCDGGGTRAVAPAQFLCHLEENLGIKLGDVFDMFCGCSIGSVLAMGLGAARVPCRELQNICCDSENVWKKVMPKPKNLLGPGYPAIGKRTLIENVVGDIKFSDCDKMLLIPTFSLTLEETCIFDENSDLYIKDVADASSAAPTYFPPVRIGDHWYVDGGMTVYDPAMCGYVKAVSKFGADADIRIISVGTGKRKVNINGEVAQNHGIYGWLTNDLIEITLNDTLVQKHLHTLCGDNYIRIQTYMEECGVSGVRIFPNSFSKSSKCNYV
eukprot:TRINITY_DN3418_c0_g1_i1.p1 TRINITY_DN3418_c0_g1~~TRINITY_DN3418_c0_g1_i1.p1  ORF type:complete len:321 (+),score=47.40 TRINITY_DN3418_c0_g1_i1:21-983(+)